jgi:hypothetical protein
MRKKDDPMQKAFDFLQEDSLPTEQQKDKMLDCVLTECKKETVSGFDRLREIVITYPWRVAFTAAAVQTAVCTMIFGTQYTNLILGFFGG